MTQKTSIRYFDETPVRAAWDETSSAALTDKIDDRELFMKGIDYSYYYEETDE